MRDSESTRLSIIDFQDGNVVIADQTTGSRTYTTRYDISLSQARPVGLNDWKAGSERSKQAEATVAAAQQNLIVRVSKPTSASWEHKTICAQRAKASACPPARANSPVLTWVSLPLQRLRS